MEFQEHFREPNRFKVSHSHANLERVNVSDLVSTGVKSTEKENPNTRNLVENMVCWICDQEISPQKSVRETHILEHYEYIFDDLLPKSAPFQCPECHKSHAGKMMLMRHFAFTHGKIYQMPELTSELFHQTTTETITVETGESSKDGHEANRDHDMEAVETGESSKDGHEANRDHDTEAVYLCPFCDCDSEFTFEDLKHGPASKHMLDAHNLLPCHLKTGQYKFAKKEVLACDGVTNQCKFAKNVVPACDDVTYYACPIEGCKSEFTFNDLKYGRAAKHMRSFHLLTPANLRDAGFVFVRKDEVIEICDDTDDGIVEEESFEDPDNADGEPSLRTDAGIKRDFVDKTLADEELSEEDESYEESCDSGIASNNTSISVNPKLVPLNDWLRRFVTQDATSFKLRTSR